MSLATTTYTASCRRDGGEWLVHVAEMDVAAVVPRLAEVRPRTQALIAEATGADPDDVTVTVDLRDPDGAVLLLLEQASALRVDADRVSPEAIQQRRDVARRLAGRGFPVTDIAVLLGISFGRAQHLVGRGPRPAVERQPARPAGVPPVTVVPVAAPAPARKPHSSYQHEAYFYRGGDDFLRGIVPFVTDGVALGQPVLVAVAEPRLTQLKEALGADAKSVQFIDMAVLGRNPSRIIPRWCGFVEEHGGVPIRGVGEPIWTDRSEEELRECQLHEALLNLAVEPDTPLWLTCPYDVGALDGAVIKEALRSHPVLVEGGSYRGSTGYGGAHHVDELFRSRLPEPREEPDTLRFGPRDLGRVRRRVARRAGMAGLDPDRIRSLNLAITELAGNSLRHGGGSGVLRTWREQDALVCEIADTGRIEDPLVGRRPPASTEDGGRGVWLANQVSDLLQIRSTPTGTVARVHCRI